MASYTAERGGDGQTPVLLQLAMLHGGPRKKEFVWLLSERLTRGVQGPRLMYLSMRYFGRYMYCSRAKVLRAAPCYPAICRRGA